ncbi:MAG: 23S rRNA (adenine(2503)-C(2))-methyltransferase RlmN [bacterium]
MNLENLKSVLEKEPKYRFKQVFQAIYHDFISTWEEASNLPKALRDKLEGECPISLEYELKAGKRSEKALITLDDGNKIETVLMKHKDGRNTVCISTQVGCPIGCIFCETGKSGLTRNLQAQEMVDQVLLFERLLKLKNEKVTNVVYMGMGEPFLNYRDVMKSIQILNDHDGINLGARHISVSTSGIVPGIQKFAKEHLEVNLAISLHGANDGLRSELMPINQSYQLKELMHAVRQYIQVTNRKVMFEYIMIEGVNDNAKDAREVGALLNGLLCVVNLIPYNGKDFKPSSQQRIDGFKKILESMRIRVVARATYGRDIKAACGQLAGAKKKG